ncbi:MAG: phage holin family protein [Candidatus Acidiferrum sp.]
MQLQIQRSVPEVLQDIVGNLQEIIRSEFRLATAEMKEEAARAAKPALTFGTGMVLAIYALGFLLLSIVYALSTVVAPWIAALIVTALAGVPAIVFMQKGRDRLKNVNLVPEKTIANVKEKVQWATNQIK